MVNIKSYNSSVTNWQRFRSLHAKSCRKTFSEDEQTCSRNFLRIRQKVAAHFFDFFSYKSQKKLVQLTDMYTQLLPKIVGPESLQNTIKTNSFYANDRICGRIFSPTGEFFD
jgi:hypothetical protein